jgi:hypothetical protein
MARTEPRPSRARHQPTDDPTKMRRPSQTSLITKSVSIEGGEGSARTPTNQNAFQSDQLERATNQQAYQSVWLGRSLDPPEHVIKQRTTQPRCNRFLKGCVSEKVFQLREGKAPPAPQLTNTRFNQTSSNVQSNNTRINPHGSDGASTLPNVQPTICVSTRMARTEPRPSRTCNQHA